MMGSMSRAGGSCDGQRSLDKAPDEDEWEWCLEEDAKIRAEDRKRFEQRLLQGRAYWNAQLDMCEDIEKATEERAVNADWPDNWLAILELGCEERVLKRARRWAEDWNDSVKARAEWVNRRRENAHMLWEDESSSRLSEKYKEHDAAMEERRLQSLIK